VATKLHALANKRPNVAITGAAQAVDAGTLLEGDANADGIINIKDFSLLSKAYGQYCGLAEYDRRVDLNDDCITNIKDFSLLSTNYLRFGPIVQTMGNAVQIMPQDTPKPVEPPAPAIAALSTVSISLMPASATVAPGAIVTVAITVAAGAQPVNGVDAFLNFDPAYLSVVDAVGHPVSQTALLPGAALSTIMVNRADNLTGSIDYSAGLLGSAVTGDFTLATIRFQAKSATPPEGTPVTFNLVFPRTTDVVYGGDSVLGGRQDGAIMVRRRHYLPVIVR